MQCNCLVYTTEISEENQSLWHNQYSKILTMNVPNMIKYHLATQKLCELQVE